MTMIETSEKRQSMPVGIVVRRLPGKSRWQKWSWRAVAALPGAGDGNWKVLREEGDAIEFHAATMRLDLHRAEVEAYAHGLAAKEPSIWVIMREPIESSENPLDVVVVTASPYEALGYADNGEDIVERIPMPPAILGWVEAFVETHYQHEEFKKRRRDKKDVNLVQDGIGDARIRQVADVYRAPGSLPKETVH